jgi:hypothetical protein
MARCDSKLSPSRQLGRDFEGKLTMNSEPVKEWSRPNWERFGIYCGTEKIAHVNINTLEYERNARLLVNSPKLLAALRAMLGQAENAKGVFGQSLRAWMHDELSAARAAIAKAEGK